MSKDVKKETAMDWVNERLVTIHLGRDHNKLIPDEGYFALQNMESDYIGLKQRLAEVARPGESSSETLDRLIRISKMYMGRGI